VTGDRASERSERAFDTASERSERAFDTAGLADRAAIVDLCVRNARSLDRRDWATLATCFVPDVHVEFEGMDPIEDVGRLVAVCRAALEPLSASQHLLGNHHVELDGDVATGECYVHAQHVRAELAPADKLVVAGTYRDRFVRRAEGWRIAERRLVISWVQGNTAVLDTARWEER
jgi:3-phenylpropionate/cinnamic acid dioxygenase small subunit